MISDQEIRLNRGERLRPLYLAKGPITVELGGDAEVYRRGDAQAATDDPADTWIFAVVGVLPRWETWLRKARVGTLRWLAAQDGHLRAGSLRTTTAIRSQLMRAGLVKPSDMWGDEVTEDGYRLALWAQFELDRRGV